MALRFEVLFRFARLLFKVNLLIHVHFNVGGLDSWVIMTFQLIGIPSIWSSDLFTKFWVRVRLINVSHRK